MNTNTQKAGQSESDQRSGIRQPRLALCIACGVASVVLVVFWPKIFVLLLVVYIVFEMIRFGTGPGELLGGLLIGFGILSYAGASQAMKFLAKHGILIHSLVDRSDILTVENRDDIKFEEFPILSRYYTHLDKLGFSYAGSYVIRGPKNACVVGFVNLEECAYAALYIRARKNYLDFFAKTDAGYVSLHQGAYSLPGSIAPVHFGLNWDMRVPGDYRTFCERLAKETRLSVPAGAFVNDLIGLHKDMRLEYKST